VVINQHQIARIERGANTARRVGDEQCSRAECVRDPHRKGRDGCAVALVEVKAAGQRDHVAPFDRTRDQASCMSHDRRWRKSRNVGVGNVRRPLDAIR
jgi:hypothetical protein